MLLLSTGMRRNEATHLRRSEWDSERRIITITHDKAARHRLKPKQIPANDIAATVLDILGLEPLEVPMLDVAGGGRLDGILEHLALHGRRRCLLSVALLRFVRRRLAATAAEDPPDEPPGAKAALPPSLRRHGLITLPK